jgi:alkylation response protein AidB-like acyl-CoA dehydrogenase
MEYWGMPYGNLTYTSIAPAIMQHGSEEQKQEYLPGIFAGKIRFAIGYSEPNAGTDLAALRTRAIKVGDEWVINGQKIWTSLAEHATHLWLAARTDPELPRHQGISLFIVPRRRQASACGHPRHHGSTPARLTTACAFRTRSRGARNQG